MFYRQTNIANDLLVGAQSKIENDSYVKPNTLSGCPRLKPVRTSEGTDPAGSLGPLWPVVRTLNR